MERIRITIKDSGTIVTIRVSLYTIMDVVRHTKKDYIKFVVDEYNRKKNRFVQNLLEKINKDG